MLNGKKLLTKILTAITLTSEVKEGVTVYRQGRFRNVHIDNGSAWCATLASGDRPNATVTTFTKIYNGSGYVDCTLLINVSGEVRIADLYGGTIAGAQYGFIKNRDLYYYV